MDQKWIQILVIMACFQEVALGSATKKELDNGNSVAIRCQPEKGTLTIWFRVLDKSGMEFIASFGNSGTLKSPTNKIYQLFSYSSDQLTLTSFDKERDSGIYSCASLKGSELKFGEATQLIGKKEPIKPVTVAPAAVVTKQALPATTTPCACKEKKTPSSSSLDCAPLIMGPLAGGCGLLLLLLIVTVLYCNKIRTRRCPHHYKRKLRVAPEKQLMTNRHA